MKNSSRKSGFTLIEIMVVLVIAAIISTITFGAFKSIAEGNKRTNCQSNLSQIYQSCRLYAQDYDGRFPYLNQTFGPPATQGGLGLWSLYTFSKYPVSNCNTEDVDLPDPSEDPTAAIPLTGYVHSNRIFHCPADNYKKNVPYGAGCTTLTPVDTPSFSFTIAGKQHINPTYLSYQVSDDDGAGNINDTYSSFRAPDVAGSPVRQLTPFTNSGPIASAQTITDRPRRDMTIVTWCRFHRKLNNDGVTQPSGRNYDNVLFADGSVENIPAAQTVSEAAPSTGTGTCTGWKRVPRAKADTMLDAANCIPSQ